jgi:hypothetical protein
MDFEGPAVQPAASDCLDRDAALNDTAAMREVTTNIHQLVETGVRWLVLAVAGAMSCYHLITGCPQIGQPTAEIHFPLHLGFALVVLFGHNAVKALGRRQYLRLGWDAIVVAVTVASIGYLVWNADYVANRFNFADPLTTTERVLGTSSSFFTPISAGGCRNRSGTTVFRSNASSSLHT